MLYLPWPYFHSCAVDVERRASATNGSLFDLPYHGDDGVADDGRDPSCFATPRTYLMSHMPWLPFLLILLPANIMTMVMYAFRAERKHISESETHFRNAMEYSAIGMA